MPLVLVFKGQNIYICFQSTGKKIKYKFSKSLKKTNWSRADLLIIIYYHKEQQIVVSQISFLFAYFQIIFFVL